ncbi:hypothetical protein ACQEU8_36485 [Streptomyces sp. CA-250714]|uniref:hypothetical protein n=1 Tax=Streptomyces sp. CA-250714 TaxID=3240060 RepID=UPI003D9055E8
MRRAALSALRGWCAYCEADRDDTVQVAVIERGSGPPHGLRMCLFHASQYANTRHAPPELAAEVTRLWNERKEHTL